MPNFIQDISHCFSEAQATPGISKTAFEKAQEKARAALDALHAGNTHFLDICTQTDDLEAINMMAATIRERFAHVVVIGTGGSTLCPQTLVALTQSRYAFAQAKPHIHFLDNTDPHTTEAVLGALPFKDTAFIIISKSGTTLETISQATLCLNAAKEVLGDSFNTHFYAITGPEDNFLRRTAQALDIEILEHANVGGRFSIHSNVGLLPAAIAGVDIAAIRKGAASIAADSAEVIDAVALQLAFMEAGISGYVWMPYVERLAAFGQWQRQIWAESLGKEGKGNTPIPALGTIDQHSQQQLFLDGPKDKLFTFITLNVVGKGNRVNTAMHAGDDYAFTHQKTMGDIMEAEQKATIEAFIHHKLPTRTITLEKFDETVLGELSMFFMLETILTGYALGIDPFNQPAVEFGKKRAREMLQAEG
jgi:glucose-6-phosphate isomerase